MINIQECSIKYHISPQKIEKKGSYIILHEKNQSYLLKEKKSSKTELFSYFEKISYPYYISPISLEEEDYEIYPYLEEKTGTNKAAQLIEALSILHKESVKEESFSKKEKETLYQEIKKEITECLEYYENLQEYIHQFSFPRVDYYNLINNISMFYQTLSLSRSYLEEWNNLSFPKRRKALILHNPFLKNFHQGEKSYFLDFDSCREDDIIQDIVSFFKEEIQNIEEDSYLEKYEERMPLTKAEKKLVFCLLCIPRKLEFSSSLYENTVKIQTECDRIHKIFIFLSEEDKKDQEANEEEFKEQDKDIEFSSNEKKNE